MPKPACQARGRYQFALAERFMVAAAGSRERLAAALAGEANRLSAGCQEVPP
jgi:hypothetical protein